jgi:hypothetical protein
MARRKSSKRRSYRSRRSTRRSSRRSGGRIVKAAKRLSKRHGGAKWVCVRGSKRIYKRTKAGAKSACRGKRK